MVSNEITKTIVKKNSCSATKTYQYRCQDEAECAPAESFSGKFSQQSFSWAVAQQAAGHLHQPLCWPCFGTSPAKQCSRPLLADHTWWTSYKNSLLE